MCKAPENVFVSILSNIHGLNILAVSCILGEMQTHALILPKYIFCFYLFKRKSKVTQDTLYLLLTGVCLVTPLNINYDLCHIEEPSSSKMAYFSFSSACFRRNRYTIQSIPLVVVVYSFFPTYIFRKTGALIKLIQRTNIFDIQLPSQH